ncbi:MAG: radical SAM protein [Polyangiaceae bacterium]
MTVLRRLQVVAEDHRPAYVVWELTLRCDQPCTHCGSRAGDPRAKELSTAEALGVVGELARMRAEEVVLIGGEAYLHEGFLEILSALTAAGIRPTMTTGGRGITAELARAMKERGIYSVSVSVDGVEGTHDRMRAAKGSFASALAALAHFRAVGVTVTSNTNVNRTNAADLEALYERLRESGIVSWQVQLTAPLGRAADRTDMLLQPWDLLELVPRIAALKERARKDGILLMPGNNLGYFGPEEALLRSTKADGDDHFRGCAAGRFVMGIESDGAVKGCPSLQSAHYVGGHLVERSLESIWKETPELAFTRTRTVDDLWGFCRTCPFAEPCRGGCTFTAHAILGRPGNNPYCHYRARAFAKEGRRERLVPATDAGGLPFDNGTFAIVVEPFDAPDDRPAPSPALLKIRRSRAGTAVG